MDQNQTDILYFLIITTSMLVFFTVLVINLLLVARNRKLRHQNDVQRLQVLQEKELASARLEVAETTWKEIAADLHDDTGQLLTVAIMQLNRASKSNDSDAINQALQAVRLGLDSVRNISRILNSDYLRSFGLSTALSRLNERIDRGGKLHLHYHLDPAIEWSDPSHELHTFRIIQELVSNTIKYAEATEIKVQLTTKENQICMVYSDNGKGMQMQQDRLASAGLGMLNIQQRLQQMNGRVVPQADAKRGFNLSVLIPNNPNKELVV